MSVFEVGNRVKYVGDTWLSRVNKLGTVMSVSPILEVLFDGEDTSVQPMDSSLVVLDPREALVEALHEARKADNSAFVAISDAQHKQRETARALKAAKVALVEYDYKPTTEERMSALKLGAIIDFGVSDTERWVKVDRNAYQSVGNKRSRHYTAQEFGGDFKILYEGVAG